MLETRFSLGLTQGMSMEPWAIGLLGLLFIGPVVQATPLTSQIIIPTGQIIIQEQLQLDKIGEHLHMWVSEVEYSTDKLEKLLAAKMVREANLLMNNLQVTLCGEERKVEPARKETKQPANGIRRYKRNILGDFLHAITGVATEEQLQAQTRLDEEIRDKIKDTLSRQVTFERTISSVYGNLTREEEKIQEKMDKLYNQRAKDKAQATRSRVLLKIAEDDIEDMEDVLDSVWRGEVGSRHTMRLVDMTGLPHMAKMKVDSYHCEGSMPVILYSTQLYKTLRAEITLKSTHQVVRTDEEGYILHRGHSLLHPLSQRETTIASGDCATCAVLVHLQGGNYKVVIPGELTCTQGRYNLTEGTTITLDGNNTCWNTLIKMKQYGTQRSTYVINTANKDKMDALLFSRERQRDNSFPENRTSAHQEHLLTSLKMQHDLHLAQQELDNFVVDTQIDKNVSYVQDITSWGILGVLTLAVLIIITCIIGRYIISKRSNTVIVTPSTPRPT